MITMHLDNSKNEPLYQQIYHYIKIEILSGRLKAGDKLPSSRSQAEHLNVSRNTVDIAYEQLYAEGYIDPKPRRGYFVNSLTHSQTFSSTSPQDTFTDASSAVAPYTYSFSPDEVDLTQFPYSIWRKLSKNIGVDGSLLLLGDNQGDLTFRNQISKYLHGSRGVRCDINQIIVGAGVDYLLQLLTSILQPRKIIAMENPTYPRARKIFMHNGFEICDIPLDEQGLLVSSLKDSKAQCCYVTPSHQFPLGTVMSISRRQELLQWADLDPDRYIIEDDYDSEFRYKGKPIPALQSIDPHQKVIYIGTFSKAIAPSIRIGYMVLPPALLEIYQEYSSFYACTVSRIDQNLLTSFLETGHFEKHLNRMRKIYKSKHDVAVRILSRYPDKLTLSGEHAGLSLVVHVHSSEINEQELEKKAKQLGIQLFGLRIYYSESEPCYTPTFLIGFGNLSESDLIKGLTILCEKVFV